MRLGAHRCAQDHGGIAKSGAWYQHAPATSAVWEYHPARQASPSSLAAVLEFDSQRLSLAELMFDLHVDNDRDVIDTVVFHPSFATMPSGARNQVGFLALDWALGEDGVTRWIGGSSSGRVGGRRCYRLARCSG
jgi:hypothetical protein